MAAVLLLGEVVRVRRIAALVAGFAGTLIIIRPGMVALDPGSMLVLGSSAVWAVALILIKLLSRTESSLTMAAYMAVFLTPLSATAAAFVWQWPSLEELGWFALMGSFGTLAHLCLGQAFREADTTVVLPVDFLRLLWSALYGYLLFNEVPVLYVWDRRCRHLHEHALPRLPRGQGGAGHRRRQGRRPTAELILHRMWVDGTDFRWSKEPTAA